MTSIRKFFNGESLILKSYLDFVEKDKEDYYDKINAQLIDAEKSINEFLVKDLT